MNTTNNTNSPSSTLSRRELREKALTLNTISRSNVTNTTDNIVTNSITSTTVTIPTTSTSSSINKSHHTPLRVMVPAFLSIAPHLEDLCILRDQLENSVNHLTRTQRELEEYILIEPECIDYKEALAENKPIINKMFKQLYEIQKLILTITAHQGHGQDIIFIPESEWNAADDIVNSNILQLSQAENSFSEESRKAYELLQQELNILNKVDEEEEDNNKNKHDNSSSSSNNTNNKVKSPIHDNGVFL